MDNSFRYYDYFLCTDWFDLPVLLMTIRWQPYALPVPARILLLLPLPPLLPAAAVVQTQYESNNTKATAKVIPVNTAFTAQIKTATDVDDKFANTSATPKDQS